MKLILDVDTNVLLLKTMEGVGQRKVITPKETPLRWLAASEYKDEVREHLIHITDRVCLLLPTFQSSL